MATARPTAASVPSVRRLREQILKEQKSLLLYEEVGSLSFFRRLPGDWQALSPAPGSGSDSDADPNTDATPKSGSTQTRAMREYVESNATQLLGETTGTPEEAG